MKYILVGGSGFIGQHFIKKLKNKIIFNIDINEGINNTNYKFCDITDEESLFLSLKIPKEKDITLINLAAHFDFQKTIIKQMLMVPQIF